MYEKKMVAFFVSMSNLVPKFQFLLNNKIKFYFIKLNINLILRFFLTPQEPHNKLMKANDQIQFLVNVM